MVPVSAHSTLQSFIYWIYSFLLGLFNSMLFEIFFAALLCFVTDSKAQTTPGSTAETTEYNYGIDYESGKK